MADEERRKIDEAFKFKLIESQAEIKSGIAEIKEDIKEHGNRLVNVESVLWGYPKSDKAGLLEQHRSLLKTWAAIIFVLSLLASLAGRLVSPMYDKWVADSLYHSTSEKWMRETEQPKVKVYKIYRKKESEHDN